APQAHPSTVCSGTTGSVQPGSPSTPPDWPPSTRTFPRRRGAEPSAGTSRREPCPPRRAGHPRLADPTTGPEHVTSTVHAPAARAGGGRRSSAAPADRRPSVGRRSDRPVPHPTPPGDIHSSVPSGTFEGELWVSLSTSFAYAQIRYTTDGSMPTASSPVYSGPLRLTATTQLRAQAFVNGTPVGEPGTALYVARSGNPTHDLPVLVLDNYGQGAPGREYVEAAALLFEPVRGTT